MNIPNGAFTAIVTPFKGEKKEVDLAGLNLLVRFQIFQGVYGIVPVGTTGESPTLTEREHDLINSTVISMAGTSAFVLAGCGSNCTREAKHYVEEVQKAGGKAVLLVDPYYNGPDSGQLAREYYGPIAEAFGDMAIVPYIIPGRTGCALTPEDLAELHRKFPNICAVKEATGDLKRMAYTRAISEPGFRIFSGDDDKTFEMMTRPDIGASGVISVVSNIAPAAVQEMCQAIFAGNIAKAVELRRKLDPLFKIVTVFADRKVPAKVTGGVVTIKDKIRNPVPIKTAMRILGMPSGPCRQPLGKISKAGFEEVIMALLKVWEESPEILRPIEPFFNVNIAEKLHDECRSSRLYE